jgi:hypothetical protein
MPWDPRRWRSTQPVSSPLTLLERVCYLHKCGVPILVLDDAEISVMRTLRALDEFMRYQRQVMRSAASDPAQAEVFAMLAGGAGAELRIEFERYCAPQLFELVSLEDVFLESRRLCRFFQKGYREQVHKIYSDDVIPKIHAQSLRNRQRCLREFAELFPAYLARESPPRPPRMRFGGLVQLFR